MASKNFRHRLVAQCAVHAIGVVLTASMACAAAQTGPVQPPGEGAPAEPVFTRARLVSVVQEPGSGGKILVRLRLLPRAKIPFTTQVFVVPEQALVADISEGAWGKFTARRIDGENTLTSIHMVPECPRFQTCD